MFRPTGPDKNPATYYQATPSPHTGETPLTRPQPSSSMSPSPGMEPLQPLGRSITSRARAAGKNLMNRFQPSSSNASRTHFPPPAAGETPAGKAARHAIDAWRKKRPPQESASALPLRGNNGQPLGRTGGKIYRYQASPAHPHAARNEAIYTTVPGVLAAALPVHPDAERRTGLANPQADHVALQLADPPIGLLTGVWQSAQGTAYHLHNGVMHRMGEGGQWIHHPLPQGVERAGTLHMLGQQADGHVYAQAGNRLLRLTPGGAEPAGRVRAGAAVRVDAGGTVHLLENGCLRPAEGARTPRPLNLLRADGNGGWEHSPAEPRDFALDGASRLVVLDHKGRLYEASPHGDGAIDAHRVDLPLPGGSRDWVVTALGQSADGALQAIAQHRDGQRVTLQRPAGAEAFEPSFTLDHAVLLVARDGLHAPADADLEHRAQLDGHAELAHRGGTAYFRESPAHPWTALNGANGKPLAGVETVRASPFGFIDRKPAFAVLREPGAAKTTIVHLNLQGRTTFLPAAHAPGTTPAGGPLTVVPAQVHAAPVVLLEHDAPIRDLAVNKERQAFFLETGASKRILASDGAGGVRDLNADGALAPLSLAVPLDNRLHVLDRQPDGGVQLKCFDGAAWKEVALDLSDLPADASLRQLRTSRTGQLEVQVGDVEGGGEAWHAVLPAMTVTDADGTRRLAPARVAPLHVQAPASETGQHGGTNQIVNTQQPSRLHLGNGDASLRTTLLGNLSTDPFTLGSHVRNLATTTADHAQKILGSLAHTATDSARAFANSLGFTAMPADQFERLKGHFHDAQLAHAGLRAMLEDGGQGMERAFRQAFALGGPDVDTEMRSFAPEHPTVATSRPAVEARIAALESLVFDLRKVGIKERALDPSLDPKPDLFSAANASYKTADLWRSGTRALGGEGDLLPGLHAAFAQLARHAAPGAVPALDERERRLIAQVYDMLHTLQAAGVRLPGAPNADKSADKGADGARRDLRDPLAIRSASIASATVQYGRLLAVEDGDDLEMLQAAQHASDTTGLGRLAKLGVSSWHDLEALDDIVSTFRADMDDPKSARRQQLLKSMGLPPTARRDEMAARMTDLLQDLYNRSTFFSVTSDNKSIAVSINNKRMQMLGFGTGPSAGGEHIHALGVERIGDSLEGDAGLVAFFVRHNKASLALSMGKDIDANPSREGDKEERSVQPFKDQLDKTARKVASFSLSAAGRVSVAAAMQHGVGAAVILSPETIPEFSRLLFDAEHTDATEVVAIGVNKGGIGLDLFETNLEVKGAVSAAAGFSADPPGTMGAQKPLAPGATPSAETRRGNWSASAGASVTAEFGMHWNEMELHLDHAWKNILGLEYQGRFDFSFAGDAGVNLGSAFSAAIGKVFDRLDSLALPNQSNLKLAGVNLALGNGNFFGWANKAIEGMQGLRGADGRLSLAPATYKRTLDAEVTAPLGREQWQGMGAKLLKAFPEAPANDPALAFSDLSGDRLHRLETLLAKVQGPEALAIERDAAPDDRGWQARARAATDRAVAGGAAWRPRSESARADVVNELKTMLQQESTALQQRAMLIPGARIELNLFGKGSLDGAVSQAVGHWHLGSKMGDLEQVKRQIPGLAEVLKRIKDNGENINQVRFVFEMRPQALRALNDAMDLERRRAAAGNGGAPLDEAESNRLSMSWNEVLHAARSNPDLYRLAVIVPHNTDDNPSVANVGFLGFNHGRAAVKAHQLFQSEVQLRYDMYDKLVGAELLEGAGRALDQDFDGLRGAGVAPLAVPRPTLDDGHFAPPSPVGRPRG